MVGLALKCAAIRGMRAWILVPLDQQNHSLESPRFSFAPQQRERAPGNSERRLLEAAGHSLESGTSLLQEPLHDASDVIAVGDVVAESRKAVGLTALFHFVELFEIEFLLLA